MSTARKLGTTGLDPLDDLRPSKQKKFVPLREPVADEAPTPPAAETAEEALPSEVKAFFTESETPGPVVPSPMTDNVEVENTDATEETIPQGKKGRGEPERTEVRTGRKVRMGANVPVELKDRADNAAFWVPGLTISQLVETALEREIKRLEKEFNGGEKFQPKGTFRYGRPKGA